MNLSRLFELHEIEENRRYNEYISNPNLGIGELAIASIQPEKFNNKYINHFEIFCDSLHNHDSMPNDNKNTILKSMDKYNMSIEEAAIISMYTAKDFHETTNKQLRLSPNNLDQDIEEYAKLLNQSLNKLPSYDEGIVYRDINNPYPKAKDLLSIYQSYLNQSYLHTSFMSSHICQGRWSNEKSGVQLIIKTKKNSNGKNLTELNFNSVEQEVLFKTNTHLFVNKIDFEKNTVELTEI